MALLREHKSLLPIPQCPASHQRACYSYTSVKMIHSLTTEKASTTFFPFFSSECPEQAWLNKQQQKPDDQFYTLDKALVHAAHRKPSLNTGSFPIWALGKHRWGWRQYLVKSSSWEKVVGTSQCCGLRSLPGNAEIAPTRVSIGGTPRPKSCIWLKDWRFFFGYKSRLSVSNILFGALFSSLVRSYKNP